VREAPRTGDKIAIAEADRLGLAAGGTIRYDGDIRWGLERARIGQGTRFLVAPVVMAPLTD
jgi:hypothetical protein